MKNKENQKPNGKSRRWFLLAGAGIVTSGAVATVGSGSVQMKLSTQPRTNMMKSIFYMLFGTLFILSLF